MSHATRRMLRQRVFAQCDKDMARFARREPKYRLACMGLGPMSVLGWLAYFDALDALDAAAVGFHSHPSAEQVSDKALAGQQFKRDAGTRETP